MGERPAPPSWLAQMRIVVAKDWALEVQSGEVLVTSSFFALLVVVVSSMAYFGGPRTGKIVASGVIWLSVAFALVLSLGKSWARERQSGAFDGLLLTPLIPSALFAGKALGMTLFLFVVELVVLPIAVLFFSVDLLEVGGSLVLLALLVTPGLSAVGTLFGALTVRTRARDLALAIVLFPLLAPALLAAIGATRALLSGGEGAPSGYYALLIVFDLIFWVGGLTLFGALVED